MPEILLSNGSLALVDDEDYELVNGYRWSPRFPRAGSKTIYAIANIKRGNRWTSVEMQRLIMAPPPGLEVDHKNRDGLDNRRVNLRLATRSQNLANTPPRSPSGFKGVYARSSGAWQAKGRVDGVLIYLGQFDLAEDAARAYDDWALKAHGEFAYLNFPETSHAQI